MPRVPVDLSAHINQSVVRGHSADFPVGLRPLFYPCEDSFREVPHRMAVVREDTGEPIATVSDRYTLVPHQRILDVVDQAIDPHEVGPVPRGIFVDRKGARMRALFKFPTLARPVTVGDDICPCLKIQNTYDGTSRIAIHIGAFRFVCTNLAVGGGGTFAGGFMSVHAGEIPIEKVADQLATYLAGFETIVRLYRFWAGTDLDSERFTSILDAVPKRAAEQIHLVSATERPTTVYAAYNLATRHATHEMRSYRTAFELLSLINRIFQEQYPLSDATPKPHEDAPVRATV